MIKNVGVGFHSLLQGIFPAQGLPCRQILDHLSHQGSSTPPKKFIRRGKTC